MMKLQSALLLLALLTPLNGCLSPEYVRPRPTDSIPTSYTYNQQLWRQASPMETINRDNWWAAFDDEILSGMMQELNHANQNIALAAANYRQSRAKTNAARASFFPAVGGSGSATRGSSPSGTVASYNASLDTNWEISLWNTLPAFEAAKAQALATAADYASIKLAMQSELAQTYFQLRTLDMQLDLYDSTVTAYAKAVQLTRSQMEGGLVTAADVAQAEAQLAAAEAQYTELTRQRALLEHAIAILVGKIPSTFRLEKGTLNATLPEIPQNIPSELLERRPDIAAAERRIMSANEQIGIARGAWFPSLNLGASRGLSAAGWLTAPLTIWSLGPKAALSLFEGGKRIADSDAAQAYYEAQVAQYRQTVLEGFKEVEDSLATLYYLEKQAEAQNRAVTASQMALRLSLSQYRGGLTTYLQVVSTQTSTLANERDAIQIQGQRLIGSVTLIKALGGGWDSSSLERLHTDNLPQEGSL